MHTKSTSPFWRPFFRMLIIIALQNVIVYGVSLLDNVMLGGYTELALSGVALVNQIQFLLQMLIGGAADGVIVISSRFWGEKNLENVKKAAAVAMQVALGIAALLFVFAFFLPEQVLGILTDKPHVIAEGAKYMRIICFTYFFFAATQVRPLWRAGAWCARCRDRDARLPDRGIRHCRCIFIRFRQKDPCEGP